MSMKIHTIYVDGGAFNNSGGGQSARICIVHENEIVLHEDIGSYTSDEAEFIAIEKAFEWVNKNIRDGVVTVFSDSKLVVNTINYLWEGQILKLKELKDRVISKLPKNVIVKWVYRDYNKAGQFLEFNMPRGSI